LGVVGFNRILLHKVFMVDGYNPMMLRRYVFFNGVLRDRSYERFLMLSNVKYVVEPGGEVRMVPERETLPRSYLVNDVEYVRDAGAAVARLADPSFDARHTAIVEKSAGMPEGVVSGAVGTTKIVDYIPGRVTIVSNSARPALAVLSDSYYPGWRASLDAGTATEALRVNYCFMGARVPAGRHTIIFEFRPASIRLGIAVSASAFIMGIFFFLRGGKRRRNKTPQSR
jgi:hypothetical protein